MNNFDYELELSSLFAMNARVELVLDIDHFTTPHTKIIYVYTYEMDDYSKHPSQQKSTGRKILHHIRIGDSWEQALKSYATTEQYNKYCVGREII